MTDEAFEGAASPSLAERINRAFDQFRRPDGRCWSNREVAEWLAEHGAHGESTISESYLALLRSGERTNPTVSHLRGLSLFFNVPTHYFLDADEAVTDRYVDAKAAMAMRNPNIRRIAFRAMDADPDLWPWVSEVVETITMPARRDVASPERRRRFQVRPSDMDNEA